MKPELNRLQVTILSRPGDVIVWIILSVNLAALIIGGAYIFLTPPSTGTYTEFYLLNSHDGENIGSNTKGYPKVVPANSTQSVIVGITNHEGTPITYTVVAELQCVSNGTAGLRVVERQEVDRFEIRVDNGETREIRREFVPSLHGQHLRLQYRLYKSSQNITESTSPYRTVHLWISVESQVSPNNIPSCTQELQS